MHSNYVGLLQYSTVRFCAVPEDRHDYIIICYEILMIVLNNFLNFAFACCKMKDYTRPIIKTHMSVVFIKYTIMA